jgi:hypothetical protein
VHGKIFTCIVKARSRCKKRTELVAEMLGLALLLHRTKIMPAKDDCYLTLSQNEQ